MNVRKLVTGDEEEVLTYLNCKPLENIITIALIRANGLDSPENRGTFYGHFEDGVLTGVAFMGKTVVLNGPREAAAGFADIVNREAPFEVRRVVGREPIVREFDKIFQRRDLIRQPSEHLFWVNRFPGNRTDSPELKRSRPEDFADLCDAHLDAYQEILGSLPSGSDLEDVRERLRQRVEIGRVFLARDEKGIAFKADLVSDSDEGVYLEAVWTRPDLRGNGYAKSAMKALCNQLLDSYRAVCLFADAQNKRALAFYRDTGFQPLSRFCLVAYQPESNFPIVVPH
jgi:predicted GNAT family acetyltransferase